MEPQCFKRASGKGARWLLEESAGACPAVSPSLLRWPKFRELNKLNKSNVHVYTFPRIDVPIDINGCICINMCTCTCIYTYICAHRSTYVFGTRIAAHIYICRTASLAIHLLSSNDNTENSSHNNKNDDTHIATITTHKTHDNRHEVEKKKAKAKFFGTRIAAHAPHWQVTDGLTVGCKVLRITHSQITAILGSKQILEYGRPAIPKKGNNNLSKDTENTAGSLLAQTMLEFLHAV